MAPGSQLLIAAVAGFALSACGGGSAPAASPSPTAPTPPAPSTPTWSASGQLVDTVTRQPLAGVRIAPTWDLAAVTTGADGSFTISATSNPPSTPYRVTVSGSNVVSRDLWITWQSGARTGVAIEAIREVAPFSMEFYRNFVRGTFDQPNAPFAVLRWMDSPRFYVKTIDQNGRPVEPEVLQVVRDAIGRAVTAFTGGRLSVAALETGTETRAEAPGWIIVNIRRDPNERSVCGFANIGANPGSITLNNDVCSCGSNKIPGRAGPARSRSRARVLSRAGSQQRDVPVPAGQLSGRSVVSGGAVPRGHRLLAAAGERGSGQRSLIESSHHGAHPDDGSIVGVTIVGVRSCFLQDCPLFTTVFRENRAAPAASQRV